MSAPSSKKTNPKVALITGITGQDGSYLAELLLSKGYIVHGLIRRASTFNTQRLEHLYQDPHDAKAHLLLHYGDLSDASRLTNLLYEIRPDEIYHLGAQSHVRVSFDSPDDTGEINALGTVRLLEAIRRGLPRCRIYQASCYDDQTRVLTTEGLKTYKEIGIGDLVLTVDTTTNRLEAKPVKRVIVSPYRGDMMRLKSRRFDLLVTPNHQLLLHGTAGLFYSTAGDLQMPDQEQFYSGHSSVKFPNPLWQKERKPSIQLSQVAPCELPCNATKNLVDEIETNDLFWLVGLYVGDGYCSPDKRALRSGSKDQFIAFRGQQGRFVAQPKTEAVTYPSHNIYFAIPSSDKSRGRLVLWLEKYGIEYRASREWIRYSSYPLAHFLRSCGTTAKEKHIPPWMLTYDREHLRALFDGLIGSDGHMRRNQKTYTYTTTSDTLLNQVVELSVKLGFRCSTSKKLGRDVLYVKEQRIIRASQAYVAHISNNHRKRPITLYPSQVRRTPYAGTVWCLEIADNHNFLVERNGRYAFCGNSSEMFGAAPAPQNEKTPFCPCSPYATSKVYAYWMARNYRQAYRLFACNGIMFNHESPRRGATFVSRKITRAVAAIAAGKQKKLFLGNLKSRRDWGYAPEYVQAMWLLLQQRTPQDLVFGTGEAHSVQEFVETAFGYANLDWKKYVKTDLRYLRPTDVSLLRANASLAKRRLGWTPQIRFKALVRLMVDADMEAIGLTPPASSRSQQGYKRLKWLRRP